MAIPKRIEVDKAKITKAINSGIPLTISTYTLPHEMEMYMNEVLSAFLAELNQSQMTEFLFSWLSSIPLSIYSTSSLYIHPLMDI